MLLVLALNLLSAWFEQIVSEGFLADDTIEMSTEKIQIGIVLDHLELAKQRFRLLMFILGTYVYW